MEKIIEIKGKGAGNLNSEYFEKLLKEEYGLKGDFNVAYEPIEKTFSSAGKGLVTIKGDFDVSEVYTVLCRNFAITGINGEKFGNPNKPNLEDLLGEK